MSNPETPKERPVVYVPTDKIDDLIKLGFDLLDQVNPKLPYIRVRLPLGWHLGHEPGSGNLALYDTTDKRRVVTSDERKWTNGRLTGSVTSKILDSGTPSS